MPVNTGAAHSEVCAHSYWISQQAPTPGSVCFGIKEGDCKLFEAGLALNFCFM